MSLTLSEIIVVDLLKIPWSLEKKKGKKGIEFWGIVFFPFTCVENVFIFRSLLPYVVD